jgi:hypothetical protein
MYMPLSTGIFTSSQASSHQRKATFFEGYHAEKTLVVLRAIAYPYFTFALQPQQQPGQASGLTLTIRVVSMMCLCRHTDSTSQVPAAYLQCKNAKGLLHLNSNFLQAQNKTP